QYVYGRYVPNFLLMGSDGDSVGTSELSQTFEVIAGTAGADNTYVANSGNYFFSNDGNANIDVRVQGIVKVKSNLNSTSPPSSSSLKIKTSRSNGFGSTMEYFLFSFTPTVNVDHSFNIDLTISVHPGEKLFMMGGTGSVNDTLYHFEYLPGSDLSISFVTRRDTTYIRALPGQYLFEQITSRFTDGTYTAEVSAYLYANRQVLFTCGNAIRGLVDAVMKMSLSDFFQFWDCYDSVGIMDVKGKLRIDAKQNLIDRTNVIALPAPAVGSFKTSFLKEYFFNEVEFGYPELKNDIGVLNGNEETNTKYLYSLGTTASPGKLDKVSKMSASPYAIEKIRTTTLQKDTTDYKADNDLFLLYVEQDLQPAGVIPQHYRLDRSLNATATGVIEPETIFNIPLSPKRNFLRNIPFFKSSLYLSDNLVFKYQSVDKNNKLVAGGIIEKENVPVSYPGAKFFLPLLLEGSFPAPDNLITLLDANPLQVFSFPVNGTTFLGILQEVSISPSSRKEQTYQFLCDPSNDLTKLIDYYG
ncbi:MAG: hypothetical protein ABIN94_21595, partial [Ferruginibacter sp.]